MRRVVVAGAALLLLATIGAAAARTVPASSGHQWCADRADHRVHSPWVVGVTVGVGTELDDSPSAFTCTASSRASYVGRMWARPDEAAVGVECMPMADSRTRVNCARTVVDTPVDDDGNRLVDRREGAVRGAADTTSDAVLAAVAAGRACVKHRNDTYCGPRGLNASTRLDHNARVDTGENECRLRPGNRCVVGGGSRPDVFVEPKATADIGQEESVNDTAVEIPEDA